MFPLVLQRKKVILLVTETRAGLNTRRPTLRGSFLEMIYQMTRLLPLKRNKKNSNFWRDQQYIDIVPTDG